MHDKSLSDAIVKHYTNNNKSWDTALKEYTWNFIGPYLLKFDHIPQRNQSSSVGYLNSQAFYTTDISSIDLKPKTLQNYRKDFLQKTHMQLGENLGLFARFAYIFLFGIEEQFNLNQI